MGSIYRRGAVYWIKYYRNGVPMRETSGSDKESVAKSLLREREGDIARGVPLTPRTNRATFDDLAAGVVTDYRINGKRSLRDVEHHFEARLKPHFGARRAAAITTAHLRQYIEKRQREGASNATINRELAAVSRAFSLGKEAGLVTHMPKVPKLREDNTRKGFFEPEQYEAVLRRLAEWNRAPVSFAYLTGWRIYSEVLPLEWRQVDFAAGTVRLDLGTTKNREGRVFPMTAELRALLEAQRRYTDKVQREKGRIIAAVFHRDGEPIKAFRRNWATACRRAGCPGMLLHDFRRTAVRNFVRANIEPHVAMKLGGHKTESVFRRYDIISESDLTDAAAKLDNFLTGTITGTRSV